MTSSPTAHPAPPVLRMRDPAELLTAVPFLIGFHPVESLVLLAFGGSSGRRVGLTQRVDLPPPEHAPAVARVLAANVALDTPTSAAVLVVGVGPPNGDPVDGGGPAHRALVDTVTAALEEHGVPARVRAWSATTRPGADWGCYDGCRCRGVLPDPAGSPLAATAVAAGIVVHSDRAELAQLVAPVPGAVLRRREKMLTRAVDGLSVPGPGDREAASAVVDTALADTAAGRLRLDDGRVLALAMALADPLVRDAALVGCTAPGAECAEQLWAALARETPDPEAAEPAALLAACALLRGDGALAGIALDRAERAWPGHRLSGLLRDAWRAGMPPAQVRDCLLTVPLPPAAYARTRRRRGRR